MSVASLEKFNKQFENKNPRTVSQLLAEGIGGKSDAAGHSDDS